MASQTVAPDSSFTQAITRTPSLTELPFEQAAKIWLETRRPFIAERTYVDYGNYIRLLSKFFGQMRINDIGGDHMRYYQRLRMATCGASAINKELGIVVQLRKRVGTWQGLALDYQRLPEPKESPGRCLGDDEEERYFAEAASNPKWDVAYHAAKIASRTGAGPGEIRKLRLKDIDHEHQTISIVEGAKRNIRIRRIPVPDSAWQSVLYLEKRAQKLGCCAEDHYLLPYMVRTGKYDPNRPSQGWRTAHHAICVGAGIKMRFYDWRHTVASRLFSNADVSEGTAIAVLGHVSPRMIRKVYNHSRHDVLRAAVETLERKPKKRFGAANVTVIHKLHRDSEAEER